ncbi:MAG: aldo/keto reductase [Siphonobacter sp.]
MQQRTIGKSSLNVSPIAFGGNVFGWTLGQQASFEILDAFVAAGFNLIDTADVYSRWVPGNQGGESEAIIGNWLQQRGNRDKVVIATKIGANLGPGHPDVSRKHIIKGVEDSLLRLQTDYIDLYQTHFDNESTPVEETLEAYARLIQDGKVRFIGTSNMSPARLKASLEASEKNGYPAYVSLQPEYNLVEREKYETQYQPIVREYGLGVLNYYSLANGFLTGKYRSKADLSKSQRGQGVKKYLTEQNLNLLKVLDEVAATHNATPASISLAWLMAQPTITAPIASATSTEQLESFTQAIEIPLSETEIQAITEASEYVTV